MPVRCDLRWIEHVQADVVVIHTVPVVRKSACWHEPFATAGELMIIAPVTNRPAVQAEIRRFIVLIDERLDLGRQPNPLDRRPSLGMF